MCVCVCVCLVSECLIFSYESPLTVEYDKLIKSHTNTPNLKQATVSTVLRPIIMCVHVFPSTALASAPMNADESPKEISILPLSFPPKAPVAIRMDRRAVRDGRDSGSKLLGHIPIFM